MTIMPSSQTSSAAFPARTVCGDGRKPGPSPEIFPWGRAVTAGAAVAAGCTGAWVAGPALVMGAAVCGLWGRGSLSAVGMAVGRTALSPGAAVAVTVPEKTADRGEGSGRMGGKGTSSRTSTRAQRKRKVRFGTARRAASRC